MRSSFSMPLLYHAYVYLEFLILACTIYILAPALTILPYFTPAAIPGLFVGCVISNTITGAAVWDILFGSLATLIGAFFTYKLRHISKWLAPLPPILANILVVPQVLRIVYGAPDSIWYLTATVGIGEVISCGILGMLLLFALQKNANQIFQS